MSIASTGCQKTIRTLGLLLVLMVGMLIPPSQPVVAQPGTTRADALVLVNSASAGYADFQHYIQPYLDHFGVPYTLLDIATAPVGSDRR